MTSPRQPSPQRQRRYRRRNEARHQLRRWLWGYAPIVLLLVAAVWDMTTKPGL